MVQCGRQKNGPWVLHACVTDSSENPGPRGPGERLWLGSSSRDTPERNKPRPTTPLGLTTGRVCAGLSRPLPPAPFTFVDVNL